MRRPATGNRGRRPAFTLLEVMLATAVAVILMGALYAAMNVLLAHAQAGRDVVEHSTLARAILARMTNDIVKSLGTISSGAVNQAGSSGGGPSSPAPAGTTSPAAGAAANTNNSSSGSNSSSANSSSSTSGTTSGTALINLGVRGDSSNLVLTVSRVPSEFTLGPNSDSSAASQIGISDLRRISYWLVGDSGSAQGLARHEYAPVTSSDAINMLPPDIPDAPAHIIAEEVKSLTFSYFDGGNWQDTWDGTTLGPDGVTPIGPPQAIAIVIGLTVPGARDIKTYRHVVAIPTANNLQQLLANGSTSSTTTNTGQ